MPSEIYVPFNLSAAIDMTKDFGGIHKHCYFCHSTSDERCMKDVTNESCKTVSCLHCKAIFHGCKMDEHVELCPASMEPCVNAKLGCTSQIMRGNWIDRFNHMNNCVFNQNAEKKIALVENPSKASLVSEDDIQRSKGHIYNHNYNSQLYPMHLSCKYVKNKDHIGCRNMSCPRCDAILDFGCQMNDHIELCPRQALPCINVQFGCSEKIQRRNWTLDNEHINNCTYYKTNENHLIEHNIQRNDTKKLEGKIRDRVSCKNFEASRD